MTDPSTVVGADLFDDLQTADADTTSTEHTELTTPTEANSENGENGTETDAEDTPVVILDEVPPDAVSVTAFAAHMTQYLMRQRIEAGEELDGSEYVVAQAVYQTVKATRDRIPYVLVKSDTDTEPRTYILQDEATAWWLSRRERLATRGTGSARASARTADENLALLSAAVEKNLYAESRLKMWTEKVAQTEKLVDKYKGFLNEQNVSEDTMTNAIQDATDAFHAAQAAKAAEKAKNAKKSGKTDDAANDED